MEPSCYATFEEDCTGSLVIEVFEDSEKVGAVVVLLHGCPQSFMPNPFEGRLEVYEDMVEVLLVLEIFLIGSASSLECNQSGCGVVHLGYAISIFWMPCDDQMCSPTQDR